MREQQPNIGELQQRVLDDCPIIYQKDKFEDQTRNRLNNLNERNENILNNYNKLYPITELLLMIILKAIRVLFIMLFQ